MAAPIVAWFGVGSNVGKVVTCDTLTAAWLGGPTLQTDTVTFIEGTGSLAEKVSAATAQGYTINTTDVIGEPFDFSSGGGNSGDHIFIWMNIFATWDTLAAGGFGLVVADDLATDSYGVWYVGPQAGYLGGWASYVRDPSSAFNAIIVAGTANWTTGGNPAQLSGVDGFGCRWKVTGTITGNTNNAFVDNISVGQGYFITDGVSPSANGKFSDFVTFESNTTSGRFGGLRDISGILFAKSKLHIGSTATNSTEFTDSGFTVVWEQQTLSDGTSSAVAAGFYALKCQKGSGTTTVVLSSGTLAAVSPHTVDLDFSNVTSVTLTNLNVDRAGSILLDSAVSWTGGQVTNSGLITVAGAVFTVVKVSGSTVGLDASALSWNVAADPNGELDGTSISIGASAHHAINFGTSSPTTMTLTNMTFTGFDATNEQNSSTFLVSRTSGTVTIICSGCTGNLTYKSLGATVIIDAGVTVSVNVKNTAGTNIQDARVLIVAAAGGPFPFDVTVTISNSGTTATVTHTAHGMASDDYVRILNASHYQNNGVFQITFISSSSYSYVMPSSPGSDPTGTIKATFVPLFGLTDSSGNLSTSKVYPSDQPISGTVRKGSGSPYYQTDSFTGTISDTSGFASNRRLLSDE